MMKKSSTRKVHQALAVANARKQAIWRKRRGEEHGAWESCNLPGVPHVVRHVPPSGYTGGSNAD